MGGRTSSDKTVGGSWQGSPTRTADSHPANSGMRLAGSGACAPPSPFSHPPPSFLPISAPFLPQQGRGPYSERSLYKGRGLVTSTAAAQQKGSGQGCKLEASRRKALARYRASTAVRPARPAAAELEAMPC